MKLVTVLVVQYSYGFEWPDEKAERYFALTKAHPWTPEQEREFLVLRDELEAAGRQAIEKQEAVDSDRVCGEVWAEDTEEYDQPMTNWDY